MDKTPSTMRTPRGHVIAQTEAQGKNAAGTYVPGVNVTAALDDTGTTFTVFVPQDQYTPDNVARLLAERAAAVAAVHGITFGG